MTEVHKDLTVTGTPESLRALVDDLTAVPPVGLRRDRAKELDVAQQFATGSPGVCFSAEASARYTAAYLWLAQRSTDLRLSTIIPTDVPRMTVAECNMVIEAFHRGLVDPAAARGLHIQIGPGSVVPEAWMTKPTASKLRAFSTLANRTTLATHPMDEKRWLSFLIAAHRENGDFISEHLAAWLESDG